MAGTLNDEILRVTGGPTINDGLLSWFRRGGASINTAYGDAERQWLCSQLGFQTSVAATNNDLWRQFLAAFPGTIQDQMLAYWSGNPIPGALGSLFAAGEQGMWYEPDVPTNIGPVRRNLLSWSENITVAPTWVFTNVSGTATRVGNVLTFGASNIDRNSQGLTTLALGDVVTASALLSGSGDVRLVVFSGTGGTTFLPVTLTPTPTLYSITLTNPNAGANGGVGIYNNAAGTAGASVTVGYMQLEFGPVATAYQKVTDWNTEYLAVAGNNVTCFQDFSGTTPVWAVEQPVGMILDRRLGLARGTAQLAPPVSALTGWTVVNSPAAGTVTSEVGGLRFAANGSGTILSLEIAGLPNNRPYEVTISVVITSGGLGIEAISGGSGFNITTSGTYKYITQTGRNFYVRNTTGVAANNVLITAVAVRELLGNHAWQISNPSRPVLSARKNLQIQTDNFADAGWTLVGIKPTISAGPMSPLGIPSTALTDTAATSAFGVQRTVGAQLNVPVTASLYAKAGTISQVSLQSGGNSSVIDLLTGAILNGPATSESIGGGWWRIRFASSPINTNYIVQMASGGLTTYTGTGTGTVYIAHAQVEFGPVATRYQRVNTATDYDAVGFPHYLRFDGVDDFLLTANINFTATDKMTVWAGTTKLSDAISALLVELSTTVVAAAGSFALYAPSANVTPDFASYLNGTAGTFFALSTYPATNPYVISAKFDIAGAARVDEVISRINGATPTISTPGAGANAGTGNFGTYPLYIGRRAGTSNAFTGQLNNLVVRGAASSAAQISSTENYIAGKMQIVIP